MDSRTPDSPPGPDDRPPPPRWMVAAVDHPVALTAALLLGLYGAVLALDLLLQALVGWEPGASRLRFALVLTVAALLLVWPPARRRVEAWRSRPPGRGPSDEAGA